MSFNATALDLPYGTVLLRHQVAGHTFEMGAGAMSILKDQTDECVLKPITKPLCGAIEIKFYEQMQISQEPHYLLIKEHIPQYKGTVKLKVGDRNVEFIKLTDLTHDMKEPCIIDIKIGKRTWDPLATKEKIEAEEKKYQACKNTVGFCIPGFQVYNLTNHQCQRYGKEYGKNLNKTTVRDALKIFLNAESGMSRQLLVQILSVLWSIQKWARNQKALRIYSSSILIAYDARRLQNALQNNKKTVNGLSVSNGKQHSPAAMNGKSLSVTDNLRTFQKLQRSHSKQNNYDEDLKSIQENYTIMLDNLIESQKSNEVWAITKMIDFAHVFPADDNSVDENYLFGIENLVKIFENFLEECD